MVLTRHSENIKLSVKNTLIFYQEKDTTVPTESVCLCVRALADSSHLYPANLETDGRAICSQGNNKSVTFPNNIALSKPRDWPAEAGPEYHRLRLCLVDSDFKCCKCGATDRSGPTRTTKERKSRVITLHHKDGVRRPHWCRCILRASKLKCQRSNLLRVWVIYILGYRPVKPVDVRIPVPFLSLPHKHHKIFRTHHMTH